MRPVELRGDFIFLYASRQNFGRVYFGVILGTITEELYIRVVPTVAQVVGNAVRDHEVIIWVIDAAARKLHHVAVTDPHEQLACIRWPIEPSEGAYSKTSNTQIMLIGIEAAESFAENL